MKNFKSFTDAIKLIQDNLSQLETVTLPAEKALSTVLAEDCLSKIDMPQHQVSTRDGYAVGSLDLDTLNSDKEISLKIVGKSYAGSPYPGRLSAGECVRTLTGALVPNGVDTIVPTEDCSYINEHVIQFKQPVSPNKFIRNKGEDFTAGERIARAGEALTPRLLGQLASAGYRELKVVKPPKVMIITCGDELKSPGEKLKAGEIYASNNILIGAMLSNSKLSFIHQQVGDNEAEIAEAFQKGVDECDLVLSCGGAFGSEKDLIVPVLNKLRWKEFFTRVAMRPGKGTAFGIFKGKPVFGLPGTPFACENAFVQFVYPALQLLRGHKSCSYPTTTAKLSVDVSRKKTEFTDFLPGNVSVKDGVLEVTTLKKTNSYLDNGRANAILSLPSGSVIIKEGNVVNVQLLEVPT